MNAGVIVVALLVGAIDLSALTARAAGSYDSGSLMQALDEAAIRRWADVAGRCKKMLDLQTAVRDGIKSLHEAIDGTPDKKPNAANREAALKLAEKVKEAVQEASKVIDALDADGSAVAFREVVQQARDDLKRVQERLEKCEVGPATQAIENDVVATLKDMLGSLKRG